MLGLRGGRLRLSMCPDLQKISGVSNWKPSNHVKNHNTAEKETVQLIEYWQAFLLQVFKLAMFDYQYTILTDINSLDIFSKGKCSKLK